MHFKVTSEKEDEIVVEYSSHGHEEQEQNDALSKQVTGSALSPFPEVAHEVLLPHEQVHQAGKGGRNLAAEKASTPEHGEKRRVRVSAVLVGGVDAVEGGGSWPLEPLAVAVFAFMLQFASKKSVLDDTYQGDDGQQDDASQGVLVHFASGL